MVFDRPWSALAAAQPPSRRSASSDDASGFLFILDPVYYSQLFIFWGLFPQPFYPLGLERKVFYDLKSKREARTTSPPPFPQPAPRLRPISAQKSYILRVMWFS